jgi:hypothetical protein
LEVSCPGWDSSLAPTAIAPVVVRGVKVASRCGLRSEKPPLELHLQKSTDPVIEGPVSRNKSRMVALWKLAFGVQANFIKDPTEEDDAADGISGTAEWEGQGKESG